MSPEEFRRYGHRLVDWLADYHGGLAKRPVMAKTRPGEIRDALPAAPPNDPEDFGAMIADLDRVVLPGLSLWQHPRFFGYFPANALPAGILADLVSHRPWRDRALVAVEPGGDRGRRGGHRLAAPDARPLARVERRHPGHRVDQHAGGADLRPRTGDELSRSRGAAYREKRARRASTCRRMRTARSTRPRCSPGSAATTCASSLSTPNIAMRADALAETVAADLAERRPPLRHRRNRGHDGDDGDRSGRRHRRGRQAPRNLAACRRGDGGKRDDPARMPVDVGGRRRRRLV